MFPVLISYLKVLFVVIQSYSEFPKGSSFLHQIVYQSCEERIILLRNIKHIDDINLEEKVFTYVDISLFF